MASLNITDKQKAAFEQIVAQGRYASLEEALDAALVLLEQEERQQSQYNDEIKARVRRGRESFKNGKYRSIDEASADLRADIKAKYG